MTREPLATRTTKHGVLICVHGLGVLIMGPSGIGKSELALCLVQRGHALVADDIVCLEKSPAHIIGRSPELLFGFIEIRGLGILDIRRMYGRQALKKRMAIALIIVLKKFTSAQLKAIDRIRGLRKTVRWLGHTLPHITIPVGQNRFLPTLVEAAALSVQLEKNGYTASQTFTKRHRQRLSKNHDHTYFARHTP